MPDAIRALRQGRPITIRHPEAVRPWQHVLEPLSGYLLLGAALMEGSTSDRARFCDGWNFGPLSHNTRSVNGLVTAIIANWGEGSWQHVADSAAPHEAGILQLSIDKALGELQWRPRWSFDETVARTIDWYRAEQEGAPPARLRALIQEQIRDYMAVAE